jgi:hypothetical protein
MSGKTTITVDREVALKFSQVSREFGISALRLASDSLEAAIEALRRGYSPKRLQLLVRTASALESQDVFPLPLHIIAAIFEEVDIDKFKVPLYAAGRALGAALSISVQFQELVRDPQMFKLVLPIRNATCNIINGQRCVIDLAFAPTARPLLELFMSYLRGLLDGYGLTNHKLHIKENIIEITVDSYPQA